MVQFVTGRVVIGLRWVAAGLAVIGLVVVVGGLGFTSSVEALVSAAVVGGIAFGIPSVAAFVLAHWLDQQTRSLQQGRDRRMLDAEDRPATAPFRESVWDYVIAVTCVLGAWALRMMLDRLLPDYVPFITFFLAIAFAGWLGGFGPAVLATILSTLVARYFYMVPLHQFDLSELTTAAALGVFMLIGLVIGALTATLHVALRRIQFLSNRLDAKMTSARDPDSVVGRDTSARPTVSSEPAE